MLVDLLRRDRLRWQRARHRRSNAGQRSEPLLRRPVRRQFAGHQLRRATLCVADEIDQGPSLAWTASPASATPDWQTGSLTGVDNLGQVACPTASLCVADENEGEGTPSVGVSTNPTGGASAWTSSTVPGAAAGLDSAACASASLCVLGGYEKTFTSTDPTGGSATWDESAAPFQSFIGSISCPSATSASPSRTGRSRSGP